MNDPVSWHVELEIRPGQLDTFVTLSDEMVQFTADEPGVLSYERFINGTGSVAHVYERYTDSAAALSHLRSFKEHFDQRFSSVVQRLRFVVYGLPSDDLRQALDQFDPEYLKPLSGFVR